MAEVALHLGVPVAQLEFGFVMAEQYRFPRRLLFATGILLRPGRRMTGLAFFPIATGVAIVQPMAGVTVSRGIFPVLIRVTKGTADLLVSTFQFEFGFLMLEGVF